MSSKLLDSLYIELVRDYVEIDEKSVSMISRGQHSVYELNKTKCVGDVMCGQALRTLELAL